MDDPHVGWLVEVLKGFRSGEGLTSRKMRLQPEVIKLLVDDGIAEEASAELEAIVLGMGDGDQARALRNSLVISNGRDGIEPRGGPEKRREWATSATDPTRPRFVDRSFSSHVNYEKAGFEELAELILDRAAQRARAEAGKDVFDGHGQPPVEDASHVALVVPDQSADRAVVCEPVDPDGRFVVPAKPDSPTFIQTASAPPFEPSSLPSPKRQPKLRLVFLGGSAIVIGILVIFALMVSGVIPLWPRFGATIGESSPPSIPPPATIRGSAAPNIDNTRGWGPERKTFTMKQPSPYPVFNSITDNPAHGDERNFLQCKDTAKDGQSWADELVAKDGHTYKCYLYVANDAAPNLDSVATPSGGGNVAAKLQNARVHITYASSATYNPGLTGILSADNAPQVWDSCNFVAARPVSLRYVSGSARLYTRGTPDAGSPLPGAADALVQQPGALLGDQGAGLIGQNAGYLLFDVVVTLG